MVSHTPSKDISSSSWFFRVAIGNEISARIYATAGNPATNAAASLTILARPRPQTRSGPPRQTDSQTGR